MSRIIKYGVVVMLCFSQASISMAQDESGIYRSPIRKVLNGFSLNFSTGYAITRYQHQLEGYYLIQTPNDLLLTPNNGEFPNTTLISGTTNWFNNPLFLDSLINRNLFIVPYERLSNPVNNPLLGNQTSVYNADSLNLMYVGYGHGVPINLSIHYNINDIRIGGGVQYEKQWLRRLKPNVLASEIRTYETDFRSTHYWRYYGYMGYRFYNWWNYSFVGELQIGRINAGPQFNPGVINRGIFTNVGVTIEDNWSEYFRITLRPSIDIRSYTVAMPSGGTMKHAYPSFQLQIGFSFNYPEIPRSPMKADHVQLKHVLTDPKTGKRIEVRGQPFWKRQNPKVGENHRKLWKNKWRNKKKVNPY